MSRAGTIVAGLRDRAHLLAFATVLLAIQLFPRDVPGGIYGLGLVSGASLALQAVALVLVYRSDRVVNFAQAQIGAFAATAFVVLVRYVPILRAVGAVCPPCAENPSPTTLAIHYAVAALIAIAIGGGVGWGAYVLVAKRFASAPPLVLTVATIFLGQLLAGMQGLIPDLLTTEAQQEQGIDLGAVPPPVDVSVGWDPVMFRAPALLTLLAAAVAIPLLLVALRRTRTGIAMRASAEDAQRAETLGVNVHAVRARVWTVAGMLAGVAAILQSMSAGAGGDATFAVAATVRILAAAVIGGMHSLPIAALAALLLGVLDQATFWAFGSLLALDGVLVLLIGAVLLLERRKATVRAGADSVWRAAPEVRPIPPALRARPELRARLRALATAGLIVALGAPWVLSPSQTDVVAGVMINGIVVLSLLVLTGWAGQISLGQFAFAAVGAFVAAVVRPPFPLDLGLAALAGAFVAVLVGLPALRLRGLHLAITSLAFALSTSAVLIGPRYLGQHLPASIDRPVLVGMSLEDQRSFYYACLVVLTLVVVGLVAMRRSRVARVLIAARDNEPAAQLFGIDVVRARLSAFAVSGGIAAIGGAMLVLHRHGVPSADFAPEAGVTVFLAAAIGGLGSVASPLLGAGALGILALASADRVAVFLASGGGGLIVLLMLRGGIGQLVFDIRDAFLRRFARRHGIEATALLGQAGGGDGRAPIASPGAAAPPARYRLDEQWAIAPEEVRS